MGFKLTSVSEDERFSYIKETFSLENFLSYLSILSLANIR
jgi:hypothetical protein